MARLGNEYFASLVFEIINSLADSVVRQCNILVSAANPDEALAKARAAGVDRSSEVERFLGVEELLIIHDEVQDGVELVWGERLWTENDLKKFLEKNVRNAALHGDNNLSLVGWYVGEITLQEVVDESAEYDKFLIWQNTYLLKEPNSQLALQRLETMGQLEEEAGAHTSDGYNATWKFLGVSMLLPVEEFPADGSLLWCERLDLSPTQMMLNMPSRDELGVFRWLKDLSKGKR
jgi:hypothetical protein